MGMLQKHKNLFFYAMYCLKTYKMRTITVFIVFVVATAMLSSVLFVKAGLDKEAEISVSLAPDIVVEYIHGGRITFVPTSYIENVSRIEGVEMVVPRVWGYAGISVYTITVIGLDVSKMAIPYYQLAAYVEKGRFLTPKDAGSGNVVIGPLLAGMLKLDVGDDMILLSEAVEAHRFHVVGILSGEKAIYTADLLIMSLEDARKFFKVPEDKVTDICVWINPRYTVDEVAAKISTLPNSRVITQDMLLRGYKAAYAARGGFYTTIWVIMLVAAALVAYNQAITVGAQSRFEVGLLKAFGFTTLDIIEVRLIESLTLGLLSASLGMAIGIIYGVFFNAAGLAEVLYGWAFLPREFHVPIYIDPLTVFTLYAATVFPLLFATVIPAWLNAVTDPELAMRRATT